MAVRSMIFSLIFILTILSTLPLQSNPKKQDDSIPIIEELKSLSGCEIQEIDPRNGYLRQFQIDITQPLDHNNPQGKKFKQRIYLSHIDEKAPMIFIPSGYTSYAAHKSELSDPLKANQMFVAHRYYFKAQPDSLDWKYLNTKQAAADHHRIVDLFKQIYQGTWISHGISKNGMTALIHRRFYPDDVTATVTQVAPVPLSVEDPRYDAFFNTVGNEYIRDKIKKYQKALLKNRDKILPLIRNYMNHSKAKFSLSEDIILDFEVCEYPFAFWQLTAGDIAYVPDANASAQELYDHLEEQGGFPSFSDGWRNYNKPMYYQAYTELGWYRLISEHIQDLLVTLKEPSYSFFAPKDVDLKFNPAILLDMNHWLQTNGNNIIYIYGGQDPYTACAIELTGQTNAVKIVQPGANHYVKIEDLDKKDLVYSTLEKWTKIKARNKNNAR